MILRLRDVDDFIQIIIQVFFQSKSCTRTCMLTRVLLKETDLFIEKTPILEFHRTKILPIKQ